MKNVLVIGATGDVGHGAVSALLKAGHRVLGVSRGGAKAEAMTGRYSTAPFAMLTGSVANEEAAEPLRIAAQRHFDKIDAVVASINLSPPRRPETLVEWRSSDLLKTIDQNLLSHFVAAKTFLPLIAKSGVYIGIGGGMADKLFPYYGYNSMIQSALRMMFRYVAHEAKGSDIEIRELIVSAMVTTEQRPNTGDKRFNWVSASEVGEHIKQMVEYPDRFPGPVQLLNSPHGVGRSLTMELIAPPPPTGT